MKIVKATLGDFERLQGLFREFSARLAESAPEYYREAYQDFSLFTGIVEHKDAEILIAEEDGVPVGTVTLWICERPLSPHIKPQRALQLSYFIAESERARDALLTEAEKTAMAHGASILKISLHRNDTEEQNVYTGIGFEPEITYYTKEINYDRT